MNGLIKKDFYLIMKEIPVLFFVIVGAGGALANLTSPLIFIIAAAVIFSTATLATIQNDKATSWNKFSITLPVSKQQIVIEKYVVYALLVIFGILVGSVIQHTYRNRNKNFSDGLLFINSVYWFSTRIDLWQFQYSVFVCFSC